MTGLVCRYYMVLRTGLEARQSGDVVDYQRYYQQWSDICMLRLFDSFMESGPQLVFQLWLLLADTRGSWPVFSTTWIALSAVASTVNITQYLLIIEDLLKSVLPRRCRWVGAWRRTARRCGWCGRTRVG